MRGRLSEACAKRRQMRLLNVSRTSRVDAASIEAYDRLTIRCDWGKPDMLIQRLREVLVSGLVIPKPDAKGAFLVRGWGTRRNETALIYTVPNHKNPTKPAAKGITISEFVLAHTQLLSSGELTRSWFNTNLPACAKEGACNFTSLGGVFVLLDAARYARRGAYERI
jgi:hypothetical protein